MAQSFHHPRTEVRRSSKEGIGLFATGPIQKGELIVATGGRVLPFEALSELDIPGHPIQIETHLVLAPIASDQIDGIFAVNHSCEPNAGVSAQVTLVALRDISAGEEICFDYAMTDSDPDDRQTFAMDCLCRTPSCRGRITDRDWRQPELQQRYRGFFSSYLQQRIEGSVR